MRKINESELDWKTYDNDAATFHRKELGAAVEAGDLGCSLYEMPPGTRAWPYHYHTANEEAIYVLAGEGLLRAEDGEHDLQAGDFVTLPADESGGHRVVNDGDDTLRYLMVSTMNEPDVTIYPEMEKFGVYVGSPPGGRDERTFEGYYPMDDEVEYWPGDED
ncbi:cupin domain-containing protein [Halorientalis pallida]|uniref:Cupin domain-containing protein n=1 Tax=Halorientalis pallida TaxID=2479928 RepID=A0A498KWC1_9EURY|nr:cupin domain-containing protein [Halorientalis pallida]RXK49538.1 cupin domain-containing protein [Halorientalis pallida]